MMNANAIPVVAIITSFTITVAIIAIVFYFALRSRQLRSQEIMAAIEKGIEVPFPPTKERKVRDYRRLGLLWTCVGIALTLALWVSSSSFIGGVWGLLPLAVGIALLISSIGQEKKTEENTNTKQDKPVPV
jgi:hypothetical protein